MECCLKAKELSSYLHEARSPGKQSKKQRRVFYDGILDVLIDVAEALQYLHTRRPTVVYRAVSMGHITVVQSDSGIRGLLTNLNCAVVSFGIFSASLVALKRAPCV